MMLTAIAGSVMLGLDWDHFPSELHRRHRYPVALIKQAGILLAGYYIVETGIILAVAIFLRDPNPHLGLYQPLYHHQNHRPRLEGLPYIKGPTLSPRKWKKSRKKSIKTDRGVTFKGLAAMTKRDRRALLRAQPKAGSAAHRYRQRLRSDAFMILTDVYDVPGYGFKSRKMNLSDG